MRFGELVKELRIKQGLTLREFCKKHTHDAGNWSKMERGLLPPPKKSKKLREYAKQLGIRYGSDEWYDFVDLASAESGIIPKDLLADSEIVSRLPIFFRTIRGTKPDKEDLDRLIDIIRKNP